MRRLFQLGITRLGTDFKPIDVTPDRVEVFAKRVEVALLTQDRRVHLLELVLHVHQQRFDRSQSLVGTGIIMHR